MAEGLLHRRVFSSSVWSHKVFELQQYVNKQHSFEFVHPAWRKKTYVSHLGGLDVSHVIPQQLCEFQLLVRRYSSLHFLQEHKWTLATAMHLQIRTNIYKGVSACWQLKFDSLWASQTGLTTSLGAWEKTVKANRNTVKLFQLATEIIRTQPKLPKHWFVTVHKMRPKDNHRLQASTPNMSLHKNH